LEPSFNSGVVCSEAVWQTTMIACLLFGDGADFVDGIAIELITLATKRDGYDA
jgi:hypothetical protein